ncbi:helix-turn-helix domain-containing protein [Bacillus sp. V33-4]|uniref:helix-turn-helix domain-containing protein n=1 Tax=Bacillus sp. V33-4 TaxID=2054169 RepID=UPI002155E81A|nr:helix-turn-helix domain-containing protein [Bacillus sp. V33-4]
MIYTEDELVFIKENLGKRPLSEIAKQLGRSPKSLEMTLIRKMGTSNTKTSTGNITAGELAKILQVDRNTVIGWLARHGLPYKEKITRYKKKFTFIDVEEFWKWAAHNKEKIDFSKMQPYSLPPEPDWVKEERKYKKARNYCPWTILEEKQLLEWAQAGLSMQTISEKLKRTPSSVVKKYERLKGTN